MDMRPPHKRGGVRPYRVSQYTRDGKYIRTFESNKEASLKTGIHRENIGTSARGRRYAAGGYLWRYCHNQYNLLEVVICQCCGKKVEPDLLVNVSVECLQKLRGDNGIHL